MSDCRTLRWLGKSLDIFTITTRIISSRWKVKGLRYLVFMYLIYVRLEHHFLKYQPRSYCLEQQVINHYVVPSGMIVYFCCSSVFFLTTVHWILVYITRTLQARHGYTTLELSLVVFNSKSLLIMCWRRKLWSMRARDIFHPVFWGFCAQSS